MERRPQAWRSPSAERRHGPLRLGILGAARSAPMIVVTPIKRNADLAAKVSVVAVAARDAAKAAAFAAEIGVPKSYGSYAELLADPEVDAVYNSLPNALHCEWTVRALLAGKHVLNGKPLSSNAREAVVMQRAAEDAGKVCIEAFHAINHPVCSRAKKMITDGEIGSLREIRVNYLVNLSQYDGRIRSKMHAPTPLAEDYRLRSDMGGGVTMDLGCYCIAIIKEISGEEPRVLAAQARRWEADPEVDVEMTCDLELPSGATAKFSCSFVAERYSQPIEVEVKGTAGELHIKGFFSSHKSNQIVLEQWDDVGITTKESVDSPSAKNTQDSFYYQMMAFVDEVTVQENEQRAGLPWEYTRNRSNTPSDSVRNMALIDDIYRAAGLRPRSTTYPPPAPYDSIGASRL